MVSLRKLLLQEQNRLEEIMQKTEKRLLNAPPGTLYVSKKEKWLQYYHHLPGEKKERIYLPKTNMELIQKLAQKSYDEKVLKLVKARLAQIKRITKDYSEDEIEQIYLRESDKRKKLICPVEPTWEQQLENWMSEDYKGKAYKEGTPVILTEKGERGRSKSEKILADYFYRKEIPYKYERPLYLKGFGIIYPDFTFFSRKRNQEIYWEHDGRMGDPVYVQNAILKIQAYEDNDIYPGERLILTYETEKTVLDTRKIEKLVERYLL